MGCDTPEESKRRVCVDAKRYVDRALAGKPRRAVIACEGACVKGEVARVAANLLAYRLERERTVRTCLGDAATGDSGMLALVERAPDVIAVEGCPLHCATAILHTRAPNVATTIADASQLFEFDRSKYFEVFDMPRAELDAHAARVAEQIQDRLFTSA